MLPSSLTHLVKMFSRLPGVGEKTAQRYALFLATTEKDSAVALAQALEGVAKHLSSCTRCGNIAETDGSITLCQVCRDPKRDSALLCVVARIQDLLSVERSSAFRGHYFVLGRLLSPLEGIGVDQLPMQALLDRVANDGEPVREVLLATPPSVDGEATALLIARELKETKVAVTRIASGVPHGGDLEFADPITIGRAIAGRRGLD